MSLSARLLVALLLFGLSNTSCRRPWTNLVAITSPDGKLRAHAVKWSGGATVGVVYGVVISRTSVPVDFHSDFACDWEAYNVAIQYLFWREDGSLEVVVSNEHRVNFDKIRLRPREGFRIHTMVTKDATKEAVLSAEELKIPPSAPAK